jgi:redox-sensitive bicupin YhaK (pirin superfamily)
MKTLKNFKKITEAELFYNPASAHHPAETYFHFSFANYHNPERLNFGALRVLNDDIVRPHDGFGMHPHRDMEVVSYIIGGDLTHQDQMGNRETINKGDVQFMSAGTGIVHSEMNEGDEPVRLLQFWVTPDETGVEPRYGSAKGEQTQRHNQLFAIAGGRGNQPNAAVQLYRDMAVYVSELDANKEVKLNLSDGRQAYLYVIDGSVRVNGETLKTRDTLEIQGGQALSVTGEKDGGNVIVFEMSSE